jgi:RNA polymerase sigma-70 factor, ECF subfamily
MTVMEAERAVLQNRHRETSLVERLKEREAAAWAELFEQHHRLVYRTVRALVNDRAVAEDLTGQVFLEALEGIGRYRDRGKPFSAWLLTIARHRSVDWLRKQKRERQVFEQERHLSQDTASADPTIDAMQVLEHLTSEQREVVLLRFVEERSLEDVAALTNRSVGAVKSLQHRALTNLRDVLGIEPREELQ